MLQERPLVQGSKERRLFPESVFAFGQAAVVRAIPGCPGCSAWGSSCAVGVGARSACLEIAEAGFLQGENHPDDIPGMIWLFRHFRQIKYLDVAIQQWAATDGMLLELAIFGEAIKSEMERDLPADKARIQFLSSRLYELNGQLTERANTFSEVLGEGARAVKILLTIVNLTTATVLVLLIVWHTRRLVLQRQSFEAALHDEKRRLAWQAAHDPLTELANRREFEAGLRRHSAVLRSTMHLTYSSFWILTSSRLSTTPAVTSPATGCCERYQAFSVGRFAPAMCLPDWAATNLASCCPIAGPTCRGNRGAFESCRGGVWVSLG